MKTSWFAAALLCPSIALAAPTELERDAREILDGLLRVDTSHGNETSALRPIEARLRAAGIPVEILESAPGRGNLIARLPGSGKKKPLLLLAHVDVVPVEGQTWSTPPFVPTEKDGYLAARGVGDDKGMAAMFTAIALDLKRQRVPLQRDVILALTADEETSGALGVKWLLTQPRARELGFTQAGIALNESGFVTLDREEKAVLWTGLAVAEKTFQSYELTVKGPGGHSSVPNPKWSPVTVLARALVKLGELRFPGHVIDATRASLEHRASIEKPEVKQAIERTLKAGHTTDADDRILASAPGVDATLRTTCVATMLRASPQDNVLATSAVATVNCRVMPDETREGTRAALVRAIGDDKVVITPLVEMGDGGASASSGEVVEAFHAVAPRVFGKAAHFSMLSTGASDSRYLRTVGIEAYGIGVWPISSDEGAAGHGAHGADERRPLKWFTPGLRYADALVRALVRP